MNTARKLLVVGAAGRTGRLLARLAAETGYEVTGLARDPNKLAEIPWLRHTVAGDATDPEVVGEAVRGQDAVITTVAAAGRGPSSIVGTITSTVVGAMERLGVARLVITSSRNLTATKPWIAVAPTRWFFRHVYADLARAESVARSSDLDWTIARATMLTDDPSRGGVHIDHSDNPTGGDWKLPRADYARALLDAVSDPGTIHQALGINGRK